jgi:PAS domain S-box-containing protein
MEMDAMIEDSLVAAVVSNPRLPDNPIVSCNQAFIDLTGYSRDEIIGRNCRFLCGPDTEVDLTERLRAGIVARMPVMVEILNYKKDGTPFRNAVMIAPIFGADGELEYFSLRSSFPAAFTTRTGNDRRALGKRSRRSPKGSVKSWNALPQENSTSRLHGSFRSASGQ